MKFCRIITLEYYYIIVHAVFKVTTKYTFHFYFIFFLVLNIKTSRHVGVLMQAITGSVVYNLMI